MLAALGKTIKGIFYLTLILVGIGVFAGMSRNSGSSSAGYSVPSMNVETRCSTYNGSYKCETQLR
jgi:hypothetical protein